MMLLTEKYEKMLKREKIYKLLSAFLILLSAAAAIWIICLLPSYFTVIFSKGEILRRVEVEEAILARRKSDKLEAETAAINKTIADYERNEANRRSFSDLLISIFRASPDEINIENISLSKNKDGTFMITLQGGASTRGDLISYVSILQKIPAFSEVRSPVSNLLEESNPKFNIVLNIKPEVYKL